MNPKANPPTVSASQSHSRLLAHLMALMVSAIWATTFVCSKELLVYYSPAQVMFMRFVIAYFVLWLLRPRPLPWQGRGELTFLLLGILGGTLYFFTENTALKHTFAANVSIIVAMAPILTSILAHFFTRDEKLHTTVWVGFAVAMSGVVLVVLNGQMTFHLNPLGDLIALAAALMWAVYSILIKKYTEQYDNFLVTRRVMLWAFITAVPLMLLTDGMPDLHPLFTQTNVLLSWLFLGVFGNAVCFAIWNIAFQRLGVVITNNYLYASPFVTLVVGYLLLDEQITVMSVIGAVLITVGVIVALKKPKEAV